MVLADIAFDCPQSCRFMFNVADMDCDGLITETEFSTFFDDVYLQLNQKGVTIERDSIVVQMADMVKFTPSIEFGFNLQDLLKCKMHLNLFDAMFSATKFC